MFPLRVIFHDQDAHLFSVVLVLTIHFIYYVNLYHLDLIPHLQWQVSGF